MEVEVDKEKERADKLDRINQALGGENGRLKLQFETQQDDRAFLLRQLVAVVPQGGGPRWDALAPGLQARHEGRITHLAEREVDLDDADAVIAALGDAADFVHWGGADAVLVVTGDRRIGSRTFSDRRVVEAAYAIGAPLLTLAGPVPTLVDRLAWHSSPIPGAIENTIAGILRGELERADRPRLDRIAAALIQDRPQGDATADAPF